MTAAGQRAHTGAAAAGGRGWALPAAVALAVAGLQLWLVARAGTDVPFYDQWGVEGRWLYPAWLDGTLRFVDLLRPHNEHHIFWTNLLNLGLFSADGQWDPLVQLAAIIALRAACAAGLAAGLMAGGGRTVRLLVAAGAVGAFLPHLAWHGVLWGFESQVYFALGFSLLAFRLLGGGPRSEGRWLAGVAAGVAAQLAMATGAFVPITLLGLAVVRIAEKRPRPGETGRVIAAVLLLALAWALRVNVPAHAGLEPASASRFLAVLGRCLAWPYPGSPWVALVANLPLGMLVGLRLTRRHTPRPGEDFALLLGFFAVAASLAESALRGGGPELAVGVPSRYADFQVLLPVANAWCLAALLPDASARWRRVAWAAAAAWAAVLAAGWLALSAEMWRGVLGPRIADRDAPVRLMQAFQASGDVAVFAGQPRLYVPSPNLAEVAQVLADPRLRGHLPPSLQPGQPEDWLSRWVRRALRRADLLLGLALVAAAALAVSGPRRRGFTPGVSSGGT
ncbi:MAG TPA: hypothetical protein VMD31_10990 [Opitutaceae bacterium]|nr:hypothetical protein [Opitutaceae bacterium]